MSRPLVIQTEDLDPAAAEWLREVCDLEICHFTDQPRFDSLLAKADAVVVRTYTVVDDAFLAKAPKLKCVARAGVALDRINVEACRARGVEVVHTPDANSVAVAEFVFALLFDLLRPRLFLDAAIPQERWNALRRELEAPAQLSELTLGILGMGRVGSRVARIASGLGMEVIFHDLLKIPAERRFGAVPVSLPDLLKRSDIFTVHIDNRPANRKAVNASMFSRMRSTVIVVNTSRGLVLEANDLAEFLEKNDGASALLDVHDPEPFDAHYALLSRPNAHLSPHLAASTAQAHANMSWVVRDLVRVLRNELPLHPAPGEPLRR